MDTISDIHDGAVPTSAASAPASTGTSAAAATATPITAAPAAPCTAVKVVVQHVSGLSYKELRPESTSDAQLVKAFEAFLAAKVAATVNCSTAGVTSMALVPAVRSHDTKGPFVLDPLHALLRIVVVSADGAPLAVNERFTLVGPPEHVREPESNSAAEDSDIGGGGFGGLWKPTTAAQLAVVERANFHKVKRLIYSVTGHLSQLPLLDGGVIEDACKIVKELYANPTAVDQLQHDFLMPYAVPGGAMPRGLLLYGPPGTGKTLLLRLVCQYSGLMLVEPSMMSAGEINRGIVGETERLLGEMLRRADIMPYLPFIVAMDEIEWAAPKRDENGASNTIGANKVLVFLSNIQGATDIPNLALVGASSRRECIDEAVRRRLEVQIDVSRR